MLSPAIAALLLADCLVFLSFADKNYFRFGDKFRAEIETLHYAVSENAANGTMVADIMADARLRQFLAPEVVNRLYFRFLSTLPEGASMIIDEKWGILRTAGEIDREGVKQCRYVNKTCLLPVDVAIGPASYFRIIRVSVEITDINDNAPYFHQSTAVLRISESASAGSSYALPVAVDADGSMFGVHRYELTSPTSKLSLSVESRQADSKLVPRLLVVGNLDRESESEYNLRLTAYDGGTPSLSATVDILVELVDSNDNSPVFDSQLYEVEVMENVPVGSLIVTVQARDNDYGDNAVLYYSLTTQSQRIYSQLFNVDRLTGQVRLASPLDRERLPLVELNVEASDGGRESRSADVSIIIRVVDVNDNAPLISINTLTSLADADDDARFYDTTTSTADRTGHAAAATWPTQAVISEHLPVGSFVAYISVTDRDQHHTLNSRVVCDVTESRDHAHFRLIARHHNEYQLVTASELDRETQSSHVVNVSCHDNGTPAMTSHRTLLVVIDDVNDNKPNLSQPLYTVHVAENNMADATVLQLRATDLDLGDNADIDYVVADVTAHCTDATGCDVTNASRDAFDLDRHSGVLTLRQTVDREKYSLFTVTIFAVDRGLPARTGSTLVEVAIDDVNDQTPAFLSTGNSNGGRGLELSVLEDATDGHVIGRLTAVDHDATSPNNRIYYYFRSEDERRQPGSAKFEVDRNTGEVRLRGRLDRERESSYVLLAVASDGGHPQLSVAETLLVTVVDVNDNDPVFEFPSAANGTVTVSPLQPLHQPVTRVLASDADQGRNSRLSYRLLSTGDNADRKFSIRRQNGVVYRNFRFERVAYAEYRVTVVAMDDGIVPRSATAQLVVVVNRSFPFPLPAGSRDPEMARYNTAFVVVGVLTLAALVGVVTLIVLVSFARRRQTRSPLSPMSTNYFHSQELTDITPRSSTVQENSFDSRFLPTWTASRDWRQARGQGHDLEDEDVGRSRSDTYATCPERYSRRDCSRQHYFTLPRHITVSSLCPPSCDDVTSASPVDAQVLPAAAAASRVDLYRNVSETPRTKRQFSSNMELNVSGTARTPAQLDAVHFPDNLATRCPLHRQY